MFKLSIAFSVTSLAGAAVVSLTSYCDSLAADCTVHGLTSANCQLAFASIPLGDDTDENTNTIGCRAKFFTNATYSYDKCRFAGPSGGGRCGPVIDSVCDVATTVCGSVAGASYASSSACVSGLVNVKSNWGAKQGSAAATEDSLECRVYHALASYGGDNSHCGHFGATGGPCSGAVSANASHYCGVVQDACTGANTQYGSTAQCLVVAAALSAGFSNASNENSLGCRTYHAQVAKEGSAVAHCGHAGPSGGDQCGSTSEAWGSILAGAPCADPHVKDFVTSIDNDTYVNELVPSGITSSSPYSISLDTTGNTQACRIYHLGVATNTAGHCSHGYLSGGGVCGNYIDNFCTFVQGACGFGTNATWQFASTADCKTQMAGIAPGVPMPLQASNNTYECRFYHAGVAASYAPGGKNSGATGAAANRILHCSHVLKNAAAGGCGYVAPTPAAVAPTPKASSASGLSVLASLLVVGASALSL